MAILHQKIVVKFQHTRTHTHKHTQKIPRGYSSKFFPLFHDLLFKQRLRNYEHFVPKSSRSVGVEELELSTCVGEASSAARHSDNTHTQARTKTERL